jgi:hypothetical protein
MAKYYAYNRGKKSLAGGGEKEMRKKLKWEKMYSSSEQREMRLLAL